MKFVAPRARPGFTLIELLLVVAIIAILISMLIPALGKARETSQGLACTANMKQITFAATAYAQENKDTIWYDWDRSGKTSNSWCFSYESGVKVPGLVFKYLQDAHKVFECPKNKRKGANNRTTRTKNDNNLYQNFGALDFDYCMVSFTGGAKLGAITRCAYFPPNTGDPANHLPTAKAATLTPMRGVPIFAEESTFWYNDNVLDGLWGNRDQITQRHEKGGTMAYLSGEAEIFRPPVHSADSGPEDSKNFCANDIFASATYRDDDWWAIYFGNHKLGWINKPIKD